MTSMALFSGLRADGLGDSLPALRLPDQETPEMFILNFFGLRALEQ